MSYIGISRLELEVSNVILEISSLEFSKMQSLLQKLKSLNFRPKSLYWVFLGRNFEKLFSYLKSTLSHLPKFCAKIKNL